MHGVIRRSALGMSIAMGMTGAAFAAQDAKPAPNPATPASAQGLRLYAIVFRPGPKWKPGKPFIEQDKIREHYAYVKGLFRDGHIFAAGGLGAENGLVLFHAADQAAADAILAADPMIQEGSFLGEVRPFNPAFLSEGPLATKKS